MVPEIYEHWIPNIHDVSHLFFTISFFFFSGLPMVLVALFYILVYVIYRFAVDLPTDQIYWDVTQSEDMYVQ